MRNRDESTRSARASWCGLTLVLAVGCGQEEGHHGAARELGTQAAGAFQVEVVLYGEVEEGEEIALDVRLQGPRRAMSVSARLADDDGVGTVNEPLPRTGESSSFHGHLPVPDGLPRDAALWIRVKDEDGGQHEVRFGLR